MEDFLLFSYLRPTFAKEVNGKVAGLEEALN